MHDWSYNWLTRRPSMICLPLLLSPLPVPPHSNWPPCCSSSKPRSCFRTSELVLFAYIGLFFPRPSDGLFSHFCSIVILFQRPALDKTATHPALLVPLLSLTSFICLPSTYYHWHFTNVLVYGLSLPVDRKFCEDRDFCCCCFFFHFYSPCS